MRFLIVTIFVFTAVFFVMPEQTLAQGIVECGAKDDMCQTCDFIQLGNNILRWIIGVMSSVCAIVIVIAGFKMVMAGGNSGAISEARSMITNTLIGFIILLAAWLIVDTVMKTFVGDEIPGFGPWNEIECVTQPTQPPVTGPGTGTVTPPTTATTTATTTPSTTTGCTGSCVPLPSGISTNGRACSGSSACTVSSAIVDELIALDGRLDAAGINWRVTEAYPPTRTHQNPCHQNGTCVDANCTGGCSASQVATFIQAAQQSGLRAVYEVATTAQRDALVAGGVPASSIQVLGSWISAPHFSVYGG
jgi:hypothetical protein